MVYGSNSGLIESQLLIIILIGLAVFLFVLGLAVCFAIISMSNTLKDIRNLYFKLHQDEVKKFRIEDDINKSQQPS